MRIPLSMGKVYGLAICTECGNTFEKSKYNQLCCSKKCAHIRAKRVMLEKFHSLPKYYKKCKYCGKLIVKKGHHTWCSVECRLKDTRENKNKKCVNCNKEFIAISTNTKLCSDTCRLEWKKKNDKKYTLANRNRRRETHKNWRDKNFEWMKYKRAEWNKNNQEFIRKRSKERWQKVKATPKLAIDARMSNLIYKALKENKNGKSWKQFVSYTVDDLEKHLESLFIEGMTWEKFLHGEIHIDHKLPRCIFNYKNIEDPLHDEEFQKCWSLDNLQPLWKEDNLRKSSKILGVNENG